MIQVGGCDCGMDGPGDHHAVGCPVHPGYIVASPAFIEMIEWVNRVSTEAKEDHRGVV